MSPPPAAKPDEPQSPELAVELSAAVFTMIGDAPYVLVVPQAEGPVRLPSGPLQAQHRTLEGGLRAWVTEQSGQKLGYVEQLYTFGDADRRVPVDDKRTLSVAYLALVREAKAESGGGAVWRNVYGFLPWEDWRSGRPPAMDDFAKGLAEFVDVSPSALAKAREQRIEHGFHLKSGSWSDELALDRYELLYEARLVQEAVRLKSEKLPAAGEPMGLDHRRILATAVARLRAKIRYRPVIFELMDDTFTLSKLQRAVEGLLGVGLHKQNFRRLVEAQRLVEETGEIETETGGRPARLVRFRREVLQERPAPGLRMTGVRHPGS